MIIIQLVRLSLLFYIIQYTTQTVYGNFDDNERLPPDLFCVCKM